VKTVFYTPDTGYPPEAAPRPAPVPPESEIRRLRGEEGGSRESIRETEIERVVRDATAKSAEDISAIVNSALARQMGSITNRVYSQVERRLTLERARRGK
jgi:hypothetical protein